MPTRPRSSRVPRAIPRDAALAAHWAVLAAIRGARKTITFETYIYWSGRIGKEFADALADRARSGVRVHLLVDWVGSNRMDPRYLDTMREAGVEIEKYHPPRWYTLHKLNY